MRKNVLLITMQDNNNIGNRLQNYAMQSLLEKHGLEVTNLDNDYSDVPVLSIKAKIKGYIRCVLGTIGLKKYKQSSLLYGKNQKNRYLLNKQFSNEYIHHITKVTYDDVFQKKWDEYSLGFVGSDQVWHNWGKSEIELPYYYLEFLPSKKRIAYAPSFGFDEFPLDDREQHIKGLEGMRYISCREETGCKLIEDAIGKKVPHVLDPTLLLSYSDWHKLAMGSNKFSQSQNNYAFLYFLDEPSPEYKAEIKTLLKRKGLKTIDFLDFSNKEIANCGPKEFISLIEHADYVLTDSFHCCVFSILFKRQFKVFRRQGIGMEKMFSRIEELLANTGNLDKIYGGPSNNVKKESFEELKQTSLNYINKVLSDAF